MKTFDEALVLLSSSHPDIKDQFDQMRSIYDEICASPKYMEFIASEMAIHKYDAHSFHIGFLAGIKVGMEMEKL